MYFTEEVFDMRHITSCLVFISLDPCEAMPCLNGGLCTRNPQNDELYICECPGGCFGSNCQFCSGKFFTLGLRVSVYIL